MSETAPGRFRALKKPILKKVIHCNKAVYRPDGRRYSKLPARRSGLEAGKGNRVFRKGADTE